MSTKKIHAIILAFLCSGSLLMAETQGEIIREDQARQDRIASERNEDIQRQVRLDEDRAQYDRNQAIRDQEVRDQQRRMEEVRR